MFDELFGFGHRDWLFVRNVGLGVVVGLAGWTGFLRIVRALLRAAPSPSPRPRG